MLHMSLLHQEYKHRCTYLKHKKNNNKIIQAVIKAWVDFFIYKA